MTQKKKIYKHITLVANMSTLQRFLPRSSEAVPLTSSQLMVQSADNFAPSPLADGVGKKFNQYNGLSVY
jgi:hypothetical protein